MEAIPVSSTTQPQSQVTKHESPVGDTASTQAQQVNANPFQKKNRKKTSPVWEGVRLIVSEVGTKEVECIHCLKKMTYAPIGTTTQYRRHLSTCTERAYHLNGQKQLVLNKDASLPNSAKVENWKWDSSKVREAFAQMLLVHELPFNFAEYEVFNHFMRVCCPNWEKLSRATAKKDSESVYELEKKKIKLILKDASRVSVTTDLWKSDQDIQYMVVIAHFVDVNLNLQKRTLNFVAVPPPHTGIVVCDALKNCFVEWEIEKKVWTVTVDNASYNDLCVSNLKSDLGVFCKLPLDGKLFHVRCCAHILNILVQYGLTEIDNVIHNIRESVKYIGKSVARLHTFGEIANQLKVPCKKLILDCGTRWNSTYMMLSNALELKAVFPRYKQRDEGYVYLPSEEDWKKAEVVALFLKNSMPSHI